MLKMSINFAKAEEISEVVDSNAETLDIAVDKAAEEYVVVLTGEVFKPDVSKFSRTGSGGGS